MGQSTGRMVAKNAGWLMASQLLTWSLTLLLTMFLPRYLGADGIGKYHLAVSLWAIASIFAGFGMDVLLTKEVARNTEKTDALLGTSLLLKTLLSGVVTIGMMLYVQQTGYPLETTYVIVVVGFASLISQYNASVVAILCGLERMEFISIGTIVVKAIWTLGAILLLILGHGVVVVASMSVMAGFVQLFLMLFFLNKVRAVRFSSDRVTACWMLKSSYTYVLVNIFLVFYMQIDIVIISLLVNEKTIGWYAAADQLFGTLLFIPTVLITAFFPALSRLHAQESEVTGKLMSKGFDVLLLFSIPIGLGIAVISGPLVVLLFGDEFAQSGPVLAVFGIVLVFTFPNMLLGQFYISIDRQRFWTWIMAGATIVTIPLDLLLIPWCTQVLGNGALGGASAFVVTELGMLIAGLTYLPKGIFDWRKLWLAGRILIAGMLMAVAAWTVRDYFIAIPVSTGAAVYLLFILVFRVLSAEDLMLIKQISHRVVERICNRNLQPARQET